MRARWLLLLALTGAAMAGRFSGGVLAHGEDEDEGAGLLRLASARQPSARSVGMGSDLALKRGISPVEDPAQAMNNEKGAYMQELFNAVDRGELKLPAAIQLYRQRFFDGGPPPEPAKSPLPNLPWSRM